MATKIKPKMFVAKSNMPGCKKGTIITDGKYPDGTFCIYDCAKEKDFFNVYVPPIPPKFAKDMLVTVKTTGKYPVYNQFNTHKLIKKFNELKVDLTQCKQVHITQVSSGIKYTITEEHLVEITKYIFVDSSGKIQQAIIGQDKAKDEYRVSVKNAHDTKDKAFAYIEKLKKIK